MAELKALLFDVDGTLADTEEIHRQSFNKAFLEAGHDWHWSQDDYRELLKVTGGKERIQHFLQQQYPEFSVPGDLWDYIAGLHKRKTAHYVEQLQGGRIPLRPGVKRLIEAARAENYRLAVATTTTMENITALLESNLGPDAMQWFDAVAAGDMVAKKKPAPDIYLLAMEQLQLAPEDCIAFEDSYNGVQAARAAQLVTIVTASEYTRDDDFSGAALILDQMGEPDAPARALYGTLAPDDYLSMPVVREVFARAAECA